MGGGGSGHTHQNNIVVPNTKNNYTTLSQNITTAPIQNTLTKCIEKSASKSLDLNCWLTNKSQQGEDMRGNEHNLSMYI